MNLVGTRLKIFSSSDPTKVGLNGVVVLETAKTLLLHTEARKITVEKANAVFQVAGSNKVLLGSDLAGRLEDRLGRILN